MTDYKFYKDVTWDSYDLNSSKNALLIIAREYGVDSLSGLDFGSLDVESALSEDGY